MQITQSLSISLAGLNAAGKRLEVSADNVANASSHNYRAKQAVQSSTPGGPTVSVQEKQPATLSVSAPQSPLADENGLVAFANVDLAEELVNQKLAQRDYEANLATLRTANELTKTLLDIET